MINLKTTFKDKEDILITIFLDDNLINSDVNICKGQDKNYIIGKLA